MGLVTPYKNKLAIARGEKRALVQLKEQFTNTICELEALEEHTLKARAFIQEVAQETQEHLEFQISSVVTHALQSIFDDTYTFTARFVQRNNRTVCDLLFTKNGEDYDPLLSAGGGVLDVASFALRVAYWSMKPNRPTFILDEAFKFVSVDIQEKVSQFMKVLSEKLGIQIVLISHLPNIIAKADNVIQLSDIKNRKPAKKVLRRRAK